MTFRRYLYCGLGLAAVAAIAILPGMAAHAAEAVAVAPTAAPAAAAPLVVAEPSWWQTLWAQIQAPLVTLVLAVAAALGTIITAYARKYLGERASQAINGVYQLAIDQGAGWLRTHLNAAEGASGDVSHAAALNGLTAAVDYVKKSYPDVIGKIKPTEHELGQDILAALGKAAGLPSGIAVATGGLLGTLAHRK